MVRFEFESSIVRVGHTGGAVMLFVLATSRVSAGMGCNREDDAVVVARLTPSLAAIMGGDESDLGRPDPFATALSHLGLVIVASSVSIGSDGGGCVSAVVSAVAFDNGASASSA